MSGVFFSGAGGGGGGGRTVPPKMEGEDRCVGKPVSFLYNGWAQIKIFCFRISDRHVGI
jgi:hypothetical protein